jgi:hypothetical protein
MTIPRLTPLLLNNPLRLNITIKHHFPLTSPLTKSLTPNPNTTPIRKIIE